MEPMGNYFYDYYCCHTIIAVAITLTMSMTITETAEFRSTGFTVQDLVGSRVQGLPGHYEA